MMVLAVIGLLAGVATFTMPETLNKKLPNTIEDVEEVWGRKP